MSARLAVVALALVVALMLPGDAAAQAAPAAQAPDGCIDAASCPELVTSPSAEIQVAGVQISADDARQPDETEPFIINSGFGD